MEFDPKIAMHFVRIWRTSPKQTLLISVSTIVYASLSLVEHTHFKPLYWSSLLLNSNSVAEKQVTKQKHHSLWNTPHALKCWLHKCKQVASCICMTPDVVNLVHPSCTSIYVLCIFTIVTRRVSRFNLWLLECSYARLEQGAHSQSHNHHSNFETYFLLAIALFPAPPPPRFFSTVAR